MTDVARDMTSLPDSGPGCMIDGTFYASGSANPLNPCLTCQLAFSASGWTQSANGENCGDGQVCSVGTCQSGCWIAGALVASGAANPANSCQICKPSASTSAWSSNPDGTSCGTAQICGSGACQSVCLIGGTVYASGATNASNPCQTCVPGLSTTAWAQPRLDCSALAAGDTFTCAAIGGSAKCWGRASELGNGSTANSHIPVQVTGLTTGVQAVAASIGSGSASHVCALVGGGVECWGANSEGQLGNNSNVQSLVPVQVTGLTAGVQGLGAAYDYSCALVNGTIRCWGGNGSGQLGDGLKTTSLIPVVVQNFLGDPLSVVAGGRHTCALSSAGAQCWGDNVAGELGDGTTTSSLSPVAVQGITGNLQTVVSGQAYTCALSSGSVQCWGSNFSGQLGNNSTADNSSTPVGVQGLPTGVLAIAAGDEHTCALAPGGVWCWGSNSAGQLGRDSSTSSYSTAVAVAGLPGEVLGIACGSAHTCALAHGGVWCWGSNAYGKLGNNSTSSNSPTPVQVQGL